MTDNTYNGWTNYATWNIPLWIDNDYGLYMEKVRRLETMDRPVEVADVKQLVIWAFGPTMETPDLVGNDWEGGRVSDVDWEEIAENWEYERKEGEV